MRLENRVGKLEAASVGGAPVIVWQNLDETEHQAIGRWRDEHPDQDHGDLTILIVGWCHADEAA